MSIRWITAIFLVVIIVVPSTYFIQNQNIESRNLALQDQVSLLEGEIVSVKNSIKELKEDVATVIQIQEGATRSISANEDLASSLDSAGIYELVKNSVVSVMVVTMDGHQVSGSGFVYDEQGHIVTNAHVINNARSIEIRFQDGSFFRAQIVGSDIFSDLAVLVIDAPEQLLNPLSLADSSSLKVGHSVMAIGNPFGFSGSMTVGVISQIGRTLSAPGQYSIPNVIQTDAALNPGNSGGPLLNFMGEVVGVNTVASGTGLGFAIPSNTVSREIPVLIDKGTYEHSWLGLLGHDLTVDFADAMGIDNFETNRGWIIGEVITGSPADKAGLKGGSTQIVVGDRSVLLGGDIIIEIDSFRIRNGDDVSIYLEERTRPGQTIVVKVVREGVEISISLVLGTRPLPS